MFGRLWNFVKRHRKKFIVTGLLTGGAVYIWKVWMPRLQEMAMERVLRELEELAKEEKNEKKEGSAQALAQWCAAREAKFGHLQQVCDAHAKPRLASLRAKHYSQFSVVECTDSIQKAPDREKKMSRLRDLQVEVLSRETSLLVAMHSLLLLRRVMFNIAGRDLMDDDDALGNGTNQASLFTFFLDLSLRLEDSECSAAFAKAARSAVLSACDSAGMMPTTQVTSQSLHDFFVTACTSIEEELLTADKCANLLLPDSIDVSDAPDVAKVQVLLDETRDYLESPQFKEVCKVILRHSIDKLISCLLSDDSPLKEGQSCPLAKLMGRLMDSTKDESIFLLVLQDEPLVGELAKLIYSSERPSRSNGGSATAQEEERKGQEEGPQQHEESTQDKMTATV